MKFKVGDIVKYKIPSLINDHTVAYIKIIKGNNYIIPNKFLGTVIDLNYNEVELELYTTMFRENNES